MASITINSNLASLNAQRRFANSSAALSDSFTRLSSGLRINRASDDAAGLSIAASLNVDRRVFNQGVRNLNDGISLMSIADGALNELSTITVRLAELAEQAATGSLSDTQRQAIDEEGQALRDEFFRIARTTEFNGQQVFDGDFGELRLQAGFGERGGIVSGLGGAVGTGTLATRKEFTAGTNVSDVQTADFNGDGNLDLIATNSADDTLSLMFGNGDGSFENTDTLTTGSGAVASSFGDFNGDGILDIAAASATDGMINVFLGLGEGNFDTSSAYAAETGARTLLSEDFNGDGILDLGLTSSTNDSLNILLGNGDGSFKGRSSFTTGDEPHSIESGDFNGDGVVDLATGDENGQGVSVLLGLGDGSFAPRTSYAVGADVASIATADFNGDGALDIATAGKNNGDSAILLGTGDGTFNVTATGLSGAADTIIAEDFNGDGNVDLATTPKSSNRSAIFLGLGDGSFEGNGSQASGLSPESLTAGDFNNDGVLDLVSSNSLGSTLSVLLSQTEDGVSPLLDFSLSTQAGARQALPRFKQKLDQIAGQRAELGAFESRVSTALGTTQVASENFATAASQITDADIAVEAARLVRNQILQQAGAAILSQANQGPALALSLLGG